MTTSPSSASKTNLAKILEDIFLVLTQKEKDVIIKRFALGSEPRQTLEKIGQQFSVTRERIRQIEKIALSKLRRTLENTKLIDVTVHASESLAACGNICNEDQLITDLLQKIYANSELDGHIVRLSLVICPKFNYGEKNGLLRPYWSTKDIEEKDLIAITDTCYQILFKRKDIMPIAELVAQALAALREQKKTVSAETISSALGIDLRFKKIKETIGLMIWRHINPKSIRDKAYIVLKREAKPLHFVEIANKIAEANFDKKMVTTQAVHNELIRDEHFVLVGRGLYGLKEWGYKKGTVADVIEDLLRKKSPLTKQEIIAGVLKQRHVKKGTISLNLQKNEQFVRVGRAVYSLDEGKKKAA